MLPVGFSPTVDKNSISAKPNHKTIYLNLLKTYQEHYGRHQFFRKRASKSVQDGKLGGNSFDTGIENARLIVEQLLLNLTHLTLEDL